MTRLLDRVPFLESSSEVIVQGERVRIRGNQIIAWVTITNPHGPGPNPRLIPFPAIVDTGHTHTFCIQERHLVAWAGLHPEALAVFGTARERGLRLSLRTAIVWVHSNEPRSRDRLADKPPFQIGAPRGIAIYPSAGGFPRLPILGLRAIADNELILQVDGRRREASLRTADRWWAFFGR